MSIYSISARCHKEKNGKNLYPSYKKTQSKDLGQVVRNSKFWYSCMFSKQTQFHSVLGYACYDKENISYMFPIVNKTHFLPTYNHSPAWTKIDLHRSDPHTNNIYKKNLKTCRTSIIPATSLLNASKYR